MLLFILGDPPIEGEVSGVMLWLFEASRIRERALSLNDFLPILRACLSLATPKLKERLNMLTAADGMESQALIPKRVMVGRRLKGLKSVRVGAPRSTRAHVEARGLGQGLTTLGKEREGP